MWGCVLVIVNLRGGCRCSRGLKGGSQVRFNLMPSPASEEKVHAWKRRSLRCFHQGEEFFFWWCAFFSLPIFKAVRADTYGLAKDVRCEIWRGVVCWKHRRCYTDPRRPWLITACHGFHNRWRVKTSYSLRFEMMTFASIQSGQLVFITCMIKKRERWMCVMKKLECCCVFNLHWKDSGLKMF
jgi:hypothetical protein